MRRFRYCLVALIAVAVSATAPAAASAACPCTIWPSTTTPGTAAFPDSSAVNVGVEFRSDQAGFITGVRFYKGAGNSGTHVGNLWSATGTLLASATFTNETASGWQQANFGAPVQISANTTYIASYFTPTGFYALNQNFFATAGVDNPPLHALQDGINLGDGVYTYAGTSSFPNQTFSSSNYWVDVVFNPTAADTTPPTVTAETPAPGAMGVSVNTPISATFSEPVQPSTISLTVSGPSGAVSGTTSYNSQTNTDTFTPGAALANSATYTVNVSGAQDTATPPNTMQPVSWQFTTAASSPPPPPPPGGPVLLVTSTSNPFTSYLSEILRTEGFNEFSAIDVSQFSASTLAGEDTVVLGQVGLTAAQVSALTSFVNGGGNLVAMRPDAQLSGLLGITKTTNTLSNAYLAVNPAVPPAAGITSQTMQFHGTADRYTLNGATSVANLYTSATAATTNPAVSLNSVGPNGGQATAFTYDLAQSVVYTHQGNPAWAGQSRDGLFPIRSHELFRGVNTTDWVNLTKVAIPQADEQQRLLANLIETMNQHKKPLPRFWYFPRSLKAVIIGGGDDHGGGGTAGRFDQYNANSPLGCSVANWTCLRFTSYVFPLQVPLTDAQAGMYNSQGFEVDMHPNPDCQDFTNATLAQMFSTTLSQFVQKFPSLPSPQSNRTHCLAWSNWLGEPTVELANGIRMDTTYYYWPSKWIKNQPGFMTGSGIPMRFADTDGTMVNVYQAPTEMTDESGQTYPATVNTLLNNADGAQGYYGAFGTNFHTDRDTEPEDDAALASAQSHTNNSLDPSSPSSVPIVSARQMLTWLDGRNSSTFGNVAYSARALSFTVTVGTGATGLTAMVPTASADGSLSSITLNGSPITYTTQTVKGLQYAIFSAAAGNYVAQYGTAAPTGAAAISSVSTSTTLAGTATVSWDTSRAATTEVDWGTDSGTLGQKLVIAEAARQHSVDLPQFSPGSKYYYRLRSADAFGNVASWPAQGSPPATFTVPPRPSGDPGVAAVRAVALPDGTASVTWGTGRVADAIVDYGTSPAGGNEAVDSGVGIAHRVDLAHLSPSKQYYYWVTSRTPWGASEESQTFALRTPAWGVADSRLAQWEIGDASGVAVTARGDGELRLAAGQSSGRYVSRVLDAQQMVGWKQALWDADIPNGTTLAVQVRTGSTSTPDATWTQWITIPGNGAAMPAGVANSRYLQYRLALTGSGGATPVVRAVGFTSTGHPLNFGNEGGG